jgi:hypothetical protein
MQGAVYLRPSLFYANGELTGFRPERRGPIDQQRRLSRESSEPGCYGFVPRQPDERQLFGASANLCLAQARGKSSAARLH